MTGWMSLRRWPVWLSLAILATPLLEAPLILHRGRLTLPEVLFGIAVLAWIPDAWRLRSTIARNPILPPIACFLAASALGIVAAANRLLVIWKVMHLAWFFGVFIFLVYVVDREEVAKKVATLLVISGLIPAELGVYQYFFVSTPLEYRVGEHRMRAYGSFDHPATLAVYLMTSLPLLIGLWKHEGNEKHRRMLASVLLLMSAALFMTFTRSCELALAVGLVVMATAKRMPHRWVFAASSLVLASGLAVIGDLQFHDAKQAAPPAASAIAVTSPAAEAARRGLTLPTDTALRMISFHKASDSRRLVLIKAAVQMLKQHPVFGVGAGNFGVLLPQFTSQDFVDVSAGYYDEKTNQWRVDPTKVIQTAHNTFFQIAAETGLAGLASFLWLLYALFKSAYKALGREPAGSPAAALRAGGLGGMAAYWFATGLFGWPFTHGSQEVLLITMALATAEWGAGAQTQPQDSREAQITVSKP